MLIYFGKKILTVERRPVKNLMFQFGHGDNVRFGEVQVNSRSCIYEVFVHCFFANIRNFFNRKKYLRFLFLKNCTFDPQIKHTTL